MPTCAGCRLPVVVDDMYVMDECDHKLHHECAALTIQRATADPSHTSLPTCPAPGCKHKYSLDEVRQLVGPGDLYDTVAQRRSAMFTGTVPGAAKPAAAAAGGRGGGGGGSNNSYIAPPAASLSPSQHQQQQSSTYYGAPPDQFHQFLQWQAQQQQQQQQSPLYQPPYQSQPQHGYQRWPEKAQAFVPDPELAKFARMDPIIKECGVCMDDMEVDGNMFMAQECTENHFFCYSCMKKHITATLADGSKHKGPPMCAQPKCKSVLQPQEVKHILEHKESTPKISAADVRKYVERLDDSLLDSTFDNGKQWSRCPKVTAKGPCRGAVVLSFIPGENDEYGEHCTCPTCKFEYCSACKDVYHYRTGCNFVRRLRGAWQEWNEIKREEYQRMEVQQRTDHEQAKINFEKEKVARAERLQELAVSEASLAREAKHCPHCGAAVIRISGCDNMTCGRDHDYSNGKAVTVGCGRTFQWASAKPYVSKVETVPFAELVAPKEIADKIHHAVPCDHCKNPEIVGYRFSCIHCSSLDVCEQCERVLSTSGKHDKDHVFQIISTIQ